MLFGCICEGAVTGPEEADVGGVVDDELWGKGVVGRLGMLGLVGGKGMLPPGGRCCIIAPFGICCLYIGAFGLAPIGGWFIPIGGIGPPGCGGPRCWC